MNNETGKKSNAWLIPVVIGTFVGAAALSCAMFFLVFKKPLEAALLFKEGIEAAENGDMDGFMDKLTEGGAVLGLDEDYMNKRFLESFLREDLYEAAIPVYERLIKNNPDNVEYYVGLAEAKKNVRTGRAHWMSFWMRSTNLRTIMMWRSFWIVLMTS